MSDSGENLLGLHSARMLAGKSGLAGQELEKFSELVQRLFEALVGGHSCLPVNEKERRTLLKTKLVSGGVSAPLVLFGENLYLQRYFSYEKRLAAQLVSLAAGETEPENCAARLDSIFGPEDNCDKQQRKAAELALKKRLAIISGGPGTGKTSTVVRIITLLLQTYQKASRIALAAPTGKAAMRLRESVQDSLKNFDIPEDIRSAVPENAQTLHRLLGVKKHSPRFHHNGANPLPWDVVVVDEASMVDLALMSKLVDALRPEARLILLGDKDQLASVESGAVLAELIAHLSENTVILTKSYRFDKGIKELAQAVNRNDFEKAWELLHDKTYANLHCLDQEVEDRLLRGYQRYNKYVLNLKPEDYGTVFSEFNKFRILCGIRRGRKGVENINGLVERQVMRQAGDGGNWYVGKPVMITRNDYALGLFNGDVGICLKDYEDGCLKVWFEDESGHLRPFLPYRLPEHTPAYAITIHKSQGSEFDDVVILLPDEDNPVLSRELIYTGITRARKNVWVHADKDVLRTAMSRKTLRFSGLRAMLMAESGN